MRRDMVVGLDVGGTKTHLRVEGVNGERVRDTVFPTTGWRAERHVEKARVIRSWVGAAVDSGRVAAVAVGAHGCDTQEDCLHLQDEVRSVLGVPAVVVNDAQLLGPAAGVGASIQLVVGTGSIAAGRRAGGENVFAGGWGWLVGDDGGGAGLVREAVVRLTRSKDEKAAVDPLESQLISVSGVEDLREVTMRMMQLGGAEFSQWAPVVFSAANEGSQIASQVIADGSRQLVRLVGILLSQQAVAERVIAAGSVVVNQSRLARLLRAGLRTEFGLELTVLRTDPVAGAIRLALHELDFPLLTTAVSRS